MVNKSGSGKTSRIKFPRVWNLVITIFGSVQATGEAFSPQKRTSALQKMKFVNLFSMFVGHFCPPESGFGLRIRIAIRIQGPHGIRIHSTAWYNPCSDRCTDGVLRIHGAADAELWADPRGVQPDRPHHPGGPPLRGRLSADWLHDDHHWCVSSYQGVYKEMSSILADQ